MATIVALALLAFVHPFYSVHRGIEVYKYYGITPTLTDWGLVRIFLIAMLSISPFLVGDLLAFLGLLWRRQFGRWVAVALFVLTFADLAWLLVREDGLLDHIRLAWHLESIGPGLALLLLGIPFACLILELVLGHRVIAYFAWQPAAPVQEPPPPPTFES